MSARFESPMIRLAGLEIDDVRHRVGWGGSSTRLPPREMQAMLALAADPGAPVASSDLARRIWPGSMMVTAYDVRRVIYRLRHFLRKSEIPLTIENVRGLGYFLDRAPTA